MSRAALQITRSQVNRWFLVQALAIVLAAISFLLFQGLFFAKSVFLGGLLCLLPQWVFAQLWLAYYKASAAPKLVTMFYVGEVIKLLLTGVLFVLLFKYVSIDAIRCLIGFMIAQVTFWMAPLLWLKRPEKVSST